MLQLKLIRRYRKPAVIENGVVTKPSRLVYVYGVQGTPEQLAEYKAIKKEKYIFDDVTKMPLFFSIRNAGNACQAELNAEKTDWRIDTSVDDDIKNLMDQGYSFEHAKEIQARVS